MSNKQTIKDDCYPGLMNPRSTPLLAGSIILSSIDALFGISEIILIYEKNFLKKENYYTLFP